MSMQQTQYSLPNFSVRPSRDQRAPYSTIHNIPKMLNLDDYAFDMIPVTFMSEGKLLVLQGNFPCEMPTNLSLFRFLGGHKYISNGDIQNIEIIQRGVDVVEIDHPENGSYDLFFPGECGCLVIRWTTKDEAGNLLPEDEVYYTILQSNFLLAAQKKGIDMTAKKSALKAKRMTLKKK